MSYEENQGAFKPYLPLYVTSIANLKILTVVLLCLRMEQLIKASYACLLFQEKATLKSFKDSYVDELNF